MAASIERSTELVSAANLATPEPVLPLASDIEVIRDLRGQTVRGTAWTAGSRLTQQAMQLLLTIVLARLLVPREFGLVAMIFVFTGFAALFVDSGFGAALVQRRSLGSKHPSTAFWLNLAIGAALSALSVPIAPLIARFYGEPQLFALTIVAGLNFLLTGLTVVQTSLLERAMRFRRLALIENGALAMAAVVGVACALVGAGPWSLVAFTLTATAARVAFLWLTSDWRPVWGIDRDALRDLWGFGSRLVGANAINYWSRNADSLLIGRLVGAAPLGIYSRAYSLMLLPVTQISSVVSRTLTPALSRLQDDLERVRDAYLRSIGVIAFFAFPLITVLFVTADPLVHTLLGDRWQGVVAPFQILCIPALLQSVASTTGVIFQSQGRTDWLLRWNVVAGTITVAAFGIGVNWGVYGVAVAYAVRTFPLTYAAFAITERLIGLRVGDVLRIVSVPLATSFLAAGAAWILGRVSPEISPPLQLLVQVSAGIAVYILANHVIRSGPYLEVRRILGLPATP